MRQFNIEEINHNLSLLNNWSFENNAVVKEFILDNFTSAISFIVLVGFEAEKMDHHPNILLHSWNKVKISLSTHSMNGITELDFILAHKIESVNK